MKKHTANATISASRRDAQSSARSTDRLRQCLAVSFERKVPHTPVGRKMAHSRGVFIIDIERLTDVMVDHSTPEIAVRVIKVWRFAGRA